VYPTKIVLLHSWIQSTTFRELSLAAELRGTAIHLIGTVLDYEVTLRNLSGPGIGQFLRVQNGYVNACETDLPIIMKCAFDLI